MKRYNIELEIILKKLKWLKEEVDMAETVEKAEACVDNEVGFLLYRGVRYTLCNALIRAVGYGGKLNPRDWADMYYYNALIHKKEVKHGVK